MPGDKEQKPTAIAMSFGTFDNYIVGDDFEVYEERINQHFLLHDVPADRKVPFLLTHLGMDTYAILKKLLQPVNPSAKSYNDLVTALKRHFKPEVNKIAERYRFHQADQKAGQSVTEYVVELKALVEKCDYRDFLKEALRDRFVFGVYDSKLRTHLLKMKDVQFDKAVDEALNWELAEKDNKVREHAFSAHVVRSGKQFRGRSKSRPRVFNSGGGYSSQQNKKKACEKCGYDHEFGKCPAKNWKCFACGKQGHAANVCFSKGSKPSRSGAQRNHMVGAVDSGKEIAAEISNLRMQLNSVEDGAPLSKSRVATEVLFVEGHAVEFEIDSGACATVINNGLYGKLFSKLPLFKISEDTGSSGDSKR